MKPLVDCTASSLDKFDIPPHTVWTLKGSYAVVSDLISRGIINGKACKAAALPKLSDMSAKIFFSVFLLWLLLKMLLLILYVLYTTFLNFRSVARVEELDHQ